MSQMKEGENRLRIVSQPIAGWIDWIDNKPMRYPPEDKPAKPFNAEKPIRAFWDLYVWDYAREGLFILEITQMSVLKALMKVAKDEDWGDFTKYDIKIAKEGNGKETRYSLTPLPHKPLSAKIEEAMKKSPVRLEALYEGGDPWTDLAPSKVDIHTGEILQGEKASPLQRLKEHLEGESLDGDLLEIYLEELSEKKKKPIEVLVESALQPNHLGLFKQAYAKALDRRDSQVQTPA